MTTEENDIMRDVYYFLRDHISTPALESEDCDAFWRQMVKELSQVAYTWNNHPLATCMLMAVYDYLDWKCKNEGKTEAGKTTESQEEEKH